VTRLLGDWTVVVPVAAALLLGAALSLGGSTVVNMLCLAALLATVLAAVHHAEVVAHRVGEPYGTLVLAIAVTVIEVALVLSMMLAGGPEKATLARDSVYSAVMIICGGVVGASITGGALRHREQSFRVDGVSPALAALVALSILVLVLPTFTTSAPTARYSPAQLAFAGTVSLALWSVFIFVQTVRHRDYFLPEGTHDEESHAAPPSLRETWTSFALLLLSLVVVVGLAKSLSPAIEAAVEKAGAPQAVIGVAIAALVLLPEAWAALRAALANRLQTSMNLALGSALACIGLTIPAVVVASLVLGLPLVLGLEAKDLVLLLLAFLVSTLTLTSGRTHLMQGAVHLVIFAAFLFLTFVP
jgi:Ca2+:H+ antiporter